jgi:hypothetical protein
MVEVPVTERGDATQDSIRVTLIAPREASSAAPVTFTIRVENVGPEEISVALRGRPVAFDLVVARADGSVVWRRLGEDAIPAILVTALLQPGAFVDLSDTWDQRSSAGTAVPAGEYTVRGEVMAPGKPLQTDTVALRIRGTP